MKITVLKQDDMQRVFTMANAIQADKDALELYSRGKSDVPLRTTLDIAKHNGISLYMPGYVPDAEALGVKIIATYPQNIEKGIPSVPSTMVLVNSETGEVCALMDGTYLTRVRTGAVSGAATDILARKDSEVFALFGTGGQAQTQLEAVLTARPIKLVRVFDLNRERLNDFVLRMSNAFGNKFNVKITAAQSTEEAISDADIITTVTTSNTPIFDGRLIKKGMHINAVGGYKPTIQEIDETAVASADKVYVDTRNGVLNECGDLMIPIEKGILRAEEVYELGEVIIGKAKGRENKEEITLFKTVGSAVLDVVTARRIYEKALEAGAGGSIEF